MIIVLILLVLKTISIKNLFLLKTFNKNFPLQRSGLFFFKFIIEYHVEHIRHRKEQKNLLK